MAIETGIDRTIELGSLRFHYWELGGPQARAVLVLHGIMGHAREWSTLVRTLASEYRVIALDQRGHGASDWADRYTASAMAGDVIALIERLELGSASVVGHSMGGMVALLAAARRPELFDRLVIVDVSPDVVSGPISTELRPWIETLGQTRYDNVQQAVDEWLDGDPLAREPLMRNYVAHNVVLDEDGRLRWRFDAAGLAGFLDDGVTEAELWDAVEAIESPALLLRGEHSFAVSAASAEHMVSRLRAGHLAEIQRGGHDLGVQQPEQVARATLAFLSESVLNASTQGPSYPAHARPRLDSNN